MKQIKIIFDLVDNWDGFGAVAVNPQTKANVLKVVEIFPILLNVVEVYPTSDGTVVFEDGDVLETRMLLEIGQTTFSFFKKFKNSKPLLFDGRIDDVVLVPINELLEYSKN